MELVSPGSLQLTEPQLGPVTDLSFLSSVVMNQDESGTASEMLFGCVAPTYVQVANIPRDDTSTGRMSRVDRVEETEVASAVPRTYYSKVDSLLMIKAEAEERSKPRFQTWAQFIWTTGMQKVSQLSKTSSKGMISSQRSIPLMLQCEFDEGNLLRPCKRCETKGWSCTAEDKIPSGGSRMKVSNDQVIIADLPGMSKFVISRALSTDTVDEIIPGVDSQYIQYLHDTGLRCHIQ